MKELLKRTYEVFVQRHWLKCIEKETVKYDKYKKLATKYDRKAEHQGFITHRMWDRYNEIYGKDEK